MLSGYKYPTAAAPATASQGVGDRDSGLRGHSVIGLKPLGHLGEGIGQLETLLRLGLAHSKE